MENHRIKIGRKVYLVKPTPEARRAFERKFNKPAFSRNLSVTESAYRLYYILKYANRMDFRLTDDEFFEELEKIDGDPEAGKYFNETLTRIADEVDKIKSN